MSECTPKNSSNYTTNGGSNTESATCSHTEALTTRVWKPREKRLPCEWLKILQMMLTFGSWTKLYSGFNENLQKHGPTTKSLHRTLSILEKNNLDFLLLLSAFSHIVKDCWSFEFRMAALTPQISRNFWPLSEANSNKSLRKEERQSSSLKTFQFINRND